MEDSRWRLFLAAPLPDPAAARLWQQLVPMREKHPAARWTRPEHYHVTLVFLGSTDPHQVEHISGVLRQRAQRWSGFEAALGRPGGRAGGRRGGVAWITLAAGRAELAAISLELDEALGSGVYAGEGPRPHVTVARGVTRGLLEDLAAAGAAPSLRWSVDRVALFRSHTGPDGARYEELLGVQLAG